MKAFLIILFCGFASTAISIGLTVYPWEIIPKETRIHWTVASAVIALVFYIIAGILKLNQKGTDKAKNQTISHSQNVIQAQAETMVNPVFNLNGGHGPQFKMGTDEKTRLDLWDDFLKGSKVRGERIFENPSENDYKQFYTDFDSGLKTALGDNNQDYGWFKRVTYTHGQFLTVSAIYKNSFSSDKLAQISGLTKNVLDCIRYFQLKNPPFTEVDLRDFEARNFKRYFFHEEITGVPEIEKRKSLIKVSPGFGIIPSLGFGHELFVKVINNTDFPLPIKRVGFIHGDQKKYDLINMGAVGKRGRVNNALPISVEPHNAVTFLVNINHFDWNKETQEVNGVYVLSETEEIFSGSDEGFNKQVEVWKKKAGQTAPVGDSPEA